MSASVKMYNGAPTFFLDGKPIFAAHMCGPAMFPDRILNRENIRYFAEAGIHMYSFDTGIGGTPPDWCGPSPGRTAHWDFSTVGKRYGYVIEADPLARFHLRVHLEMHPTWWHELYPEEREIDSSGRRLRQSFASVIWREQAKEFLRAMIGHFKKVGLVDRVVAYKTGAGDTSEWVKSATSMFTPCGDYSEPMRRHFRAWLRQRYQDDAAALRTAWADPRVTFANAEVPPAAAQWNPTNFTFRDPRREQPVIDYYRCLADLCGDLVIDFNRTVKEETNGQAAAGAFFGYVMELAWNGSFFADGTESEWSAIQRSGHLGLAKLLESPYVDYIVSPYSYGFRGMGGEGPCMQVAESMRLHGKLYIMEEDSRPHLNWHDPNYGRVYTLEDSIAILQRNFAYVVTHGQGVWWGSGLPTYPAVELSQQPAFRPLIKRFNDIGNWSLQLERSPSAEVAVLLDDESYYYEMLKNDLDLPLIFQQRLWGLPHMGAPFDTYLLNDLLEGRLKPYKLYIFLNTFWLDQKRRAALKREIRQDGRVALWIYGAGYIQDEPSLANMTDLTGFGFGCDTIPWSQLMQPTNFQHPIMQEIPQDFFWGTNAQLAPIFHVEDKEATVLGNVIYTKGRNLPGFAIKTFPNWTSIYMAAPNIPALVLRGIARHAGVHLYNDQGDTLYATPQLLAVHTAPGGERTFRLPKQVEVVYDLFEQKEIARNADRFQVTLPPASTSFYYTGEARILSTLPATPQ